MPNNQPRVCPDDLRARHARIAIAIDEVNISGNEDVLIIRAACRQNEHAQERDFKNDQCKSSERSHSIDNRKSAVENRKLNWARQDSNLGPRDYESPALTAELQAQLPMK